MEEVAQAVEKVKKEWDQTFKQTQDHVKAIERCGKSGKGTEEANSLPRLNGAAQDGLALLRSLQFRLDLLAPQLLKEQEVQSAQLMLKAWKEQYQRFGHLGCILVTLQFTRQFWHPLSAHGFFLLVFSLLPNTHCMVHECWSVGL